MLLAMSTLGRGIFCGILIMIVVGFFVLLALAVIHDSRLRDRRKALSNCAQARDYVDAITKVIPYTATQTTGPDKTGVIRISTVWSGRSGMVECTSMPVSPMAKATVLPEIRLKVTKGGESSAVSSCGGRAWDSPEEFAQSLLALLKSIGYEISPDSELELINGMHALPPMVAGYLQSEPTNEAVPTPS